MASPSVLTGISVTGIGFLQLAGLACPVRRTETPEAVTLLHALSTCLAGGGVGAGIGLELTPGAFKVLRTLTAHFLCQLG